MQFWKSDWDRARDRFVAWWKHEGLVLSIQSPIDQPHQPIAKPERPATLEQEWIDPEYRLRKDEYQLSRTFFGGESFPYFDAHIGPGSLALFLGSPPQYTGDSVWYHACLDDLESSPPFRLDPDHPWFQRQLALLETGMRLGDGRFLVGMPDLIENMDTLASLRGSQALMFDLLENPDAVVERIQQINTVYFDAFDRFFDVIRDEWGGNAFSAFRIWGPGKTGKVQCDASAMFSPRMFKKFVLPALMEQCAWLDYSLYHLDGTQAVVHLDQLLEIEPLDAIEWTPQAGIERGGHPRWYEMYRRILAAGKSVQAVEVLPDEVIPLLDAVGGRGMMITVTAESEAQARAIVEQAERYR